MSDQQCPVCGGTFPEQVKVCPVDGTRLDRVPTLVGTPNPDVTDTQPPPAPGPRKRPISRVQDPGVTLGSYRVLSLLGKGGMGEVYLAEHVKLKRKVALKLLRSRYTGDADSVRRFFNEARAVNQIQHTNIVEITDFVEDRKSGTYYIMEYLEGQTLGDRLQSQEPLPLREALDIAIQVADALAAMHGAGIIHRDLKPDNIFLTVGPRPGKHLVKLLDFGLVKLADPPTDESQIKTNPDTLIGTPEYMSPEQVRGVDETDNRSDLYSLGVVLYELVTGVRPIAAPSYGQLLIDVVSSKPLPPSKVRDEKGPGLPAALENLIMRCLEKKPEARPRSADDVLATLRGVAESLPPDLATVGATAGRRGGVSSRVLWAVAAGLLVVALVLAAIALFALPEKQPAGTGAPVAQRKGKPIARLSQLWGEVHHRERGNDSWREANRGMDLHYHDALKTGRGARSRVKFLVGGRLNVDELSVVLIEPPPQPTGANGKPAAPVARLQQGTVRAEARPGAPLRFITPDGRTGEVVARGNGPVAVRLRARQGRASELAVIKGEGELRSGGRKVALK
ncbi:MAG: serine/threonine protein kinase, partial [Deltaproteobacteria bacterium]|nr:serine/threonine protein kinase [Deltaproteobacteria bacterium]